jgi:lipopolysaccharide transport system permease protein
MHKSRIFSRQVRALTIANLKSRYRKTFAGFLWVVLNPMITFGVQALVFHNFLKIDFSRYVLFLAAGLLPWIFIVQTIEMSASVFVTNGQLMKSIAATPLIYLCSQVLDCFINFLAGLLLALLPIWIFYDGVRWPLLLIPLPVISLAIGVFALSWLLAIAQVFFRDTRFLIGFSMNIGFFLTPIFYRRDFVPDGLQWLISLNPFYHLIAPFQVLVHDFQWPLFYESMLYSLLTSFVLLTLAYVWWSRRRNQVYFYV